VGTLLGTAYPGLTARIIQALRAHLDFRRLKAGGSLEFHHDTEGSITKVVYRQSPVDIFEAWPDGDAWAASRRDVPVERRLVLVAGTLEENLFDSMEALGEQAQLVLDFAEIFAWDFDFASDSQPGDRFRMLVEKIHTGDQFVKYGRILVAEYESDGTTHTGIYFQEGRGRLLHRGRIPAAGLPEVTAGVHPDQLRVQPRSAASDPGRRAAPPGRGLRRPLGHAGLGSGDGGGAAGGAGQREP
jgi:hypothetical protein